MLLIRRFQRYIAYAWVIFLPKFVSRGVRVPLKNYFLNFSREEEEEEEDNGRSQEGIEKKTKLGRLRAFSDQPSRHPMLII